MVVTVKNTIRIGNPTTTYENVDTIRDYGGYIVLWEQLPGNKQRTIQVRKEFNEISVTMKDKVQV